MKTSSASTHPQLSVAILHGLFYLAIACPTLGGFSRAQSSPGVSGEPQNGPIILALNKPIEREMRGGEKHSYKVHAEAGKFVHVVAMQEGIDVSVALFDPGGKQILISDSQNGSYGPEPVSFIAEASGDFQLEVAAGSSDAPAGHYRIQLTDLRPPTEADRTRIKAEGTYREGSLLYSQGGADSSRAAAAKWQESFALWQSIDDEYGQALSLYGIGQIYSSLSEGRKALDYYNQALPLERAVGDRAIEGSTLTEMGQVYDDLGELQKALDYHNQALPLERAAGDRADEANTLNNIGEVYDDLGDKQKALDFYNQSLLLERAVGSRKDEASTLNNVGEVYRGLREKQKALDYYNQALVLERAVRDRADEAITLGNIGLTYDDLGEEQKALDYYSQALPILREVGDRRVEAHTLTGMGKIYLDLGEAQRALDYYNQALPLERDVGDRLAEGATLNNIGRVYAVLGEKQKALDFYSQALPLRRAVGFRAGEARTLNSMGLIYFDLGDKQKALDYYNQALPIERAVGDRADEANTLSNIGVTYEALGDNQKALDCFNQALPILRAIQDPLGEGRLLAKLMNYWKKLNNPNVAILFGKQAIDRFQQIRRNIEGLGKEVQQSFLISKEADYRELAELLISQGRLPEAQQVLDLLKVEEYAQFTELRGSSGSETNAVALNPAEEKSNNEYEQITADITSIGSEWTQLHANSSRSADEEKRYTELSVRLTAANQKLQAFLENLYVSFGKGDQANAKVESVNEQTSSLETLVGELGAGTAAVYTLVLDDKCIEMVITPATRVAREIPITKLALRAKVFAFANSLSQRQSQQMIQANALDLYNILIKPIEKDLQGAQAKTLVWSLDDVLRYLPMAALYDGKQYLLERFQNVVITTASVGNLKDQPQVSKWRGLAMGVSKNYDGLGQLDAVPGELDSVVRSSNTPASHGPVPGTILLNDSFTESSMETALEQHPPLVHIASHYVFQPGDDKKSYLLLGGKETGGQGFHLTLADLRDDQRMDFKGVELLTLSACLTASGSTNSDGREIDGLGITAQRKGAKAVLATLWPVDDASVGLLMATFYKIWTTTPGITKAEALQQAQLSLLHGANSQYANPFYWAPFILIGNWK
jgi:CHAT domain-containing protein/Tfp pilus assembly protein PilF